MRPTNRVLLVLLALSLTLTLPRSIAADPPDQGAYEDAIVQALNETARELGYSTTAEKSVGSYDQRTYWRIAMEGSREGFHVKEYPSASEAQAKFAEYDPVPHGGYQFDFHGYPAVRHPYAPYYVAILIDRFIFYLIWAEHNQMQIPEVFYRHAVFSGFMINDGSVQEPASELAIGTPIPEITPTPTPTPGATIILRALAENYGEATKAIDNSANLGSITISGRVIDLLTGAGIGGATVTITAGAASASALSAADGSYTLTALAPGGADNGQVSGLDLALPAQANVTIEVLPGRTELLADGQSTADVTIRVQDLQGNPIRDREIGLDVSADAGPGSIHPSRAATDANGIIQATYTAFKPAPDLILDHSRVEVTLNARDIATGLIGSATIHVGQYQLAVLYDEFIPACRQCAFPAKFTVMVTDAWFRPVPDAPLAFEIADFSADATLVQDPDASTNQQALSLTTDSNGQATVYLKWQGSLDITEAVRQVVILDRTTHARETRGVRVHGLDIAIARVQEAGFTGVTGHQAFFKLYIKERAHPDLPLGRFNVAAPNKLKLRVTINQFHSEGSGISYAYESDGGWDQDELGTFVKMFATPHMPHITPVNDGTSWYEIRVDAVIDEGVYLPDLNRANNDTILALTTGSPDGWLHTWLTEGLLTPHSYTGVLVKCVSRFLPGLGDAITVIDTLGQVYNADVLGLGQSTAQVLTEELQRRATSPGLLTRLKASTLNNVVSCMQDAYGVYKGSSQGYALPGPRFCAGTPSWSLSASDAVWPQASDIFDPDMMGQFALGPARSSPGQRSAMMVGPAATDVIPAIYSDSGRLGELPGYAIQAGSAPWSLAIAYAPAAEDFDGSAFAHTIDQFIHGFLLASPDQRAVVVFGLPATDVILLDAQGRAVDDAGYTSAGGDMVVYLLPATNRYTLQVTTGSPFDVAVYQAGSSDDLRHTHRHALQPDGPVLASMLIDGGSDYALAVDDNGDRAADRILPGVAISHDVVRPSISGVKPAPGATLSAGGITIVGEFADNPGGSGIDLTAVHVFLDGQDQTAMAVVAADRLTLHAGALPAGQHHVRVDVSDREGNRARTEWSFVVGSGVAGLLAKPLLLPLAIGGSGLLLLALVMLALVLPRRRQPGRQAPVATFAAPDAWWLARGDQRYGPYNWAHLVAIGREGRIHPQDLVYDPRTGAWRVASGYPDLMGRR